MVMPTDPKKRAEALAEKPRPMVTPRVPYPDPDAEPVPTPLQGPNEQSIVASGMTVEEWKLKHPGQVMGPAPEEVGQVTTDPVDGSDPEPDPIWPGTFTSVDPDGKKTRAENEDPIIPPGPLPEPPVQGQLVIVNPAEGSTVPAVHDIVGGGAMAGATVELWSSDRTEGTDPPNATVQAGPGGAWAFTGDTPAVAGPITWTVKDGTSEASVNVTVEGVVTQGVASPWQDMNTHAALNAYLYDHNIPKASDWDSMTLVQKRAWLDGL